MAIDFVGHSMPVLSGGTLTASAPATTQPGNLLLFLPNVKVSGGLPADPVGWEKIGAKIRSGRVAAAYLKVAQSAGSGAASVSYGAGTITDANASSSGGGIFCFRDTVAPAGTYGWYLSATDGEDPSNGMSYDFSGIDLGSIPVDALVVALVTATANIITGFSNLSLSSGGTPTFAAGTVLDNGQLGGTTMGWALTSHRCTGLGSDPLAYHFDVTFIPGEAVAVFFVIRSTTPSVLKHAPVITLVSPAEGDIDPDEPIVVDVTDPDGAGDISSIVPRFIFPNLPLAPELAHSWEDAAFDGAYDAASTRTSITDGFRYTFERDTGWIDTEVRLYITAQSIGVETPDTADALFTFTVPDALVGVPGSCPEPDTVIALVSPAIGSTLEPATTIVVDVTDPGVGRTFATSIWVNGVAVYTTAGGWSAAFDAASAVADITDGSRYTIDPDVDWEECQFVKVAVTDEDGLVTTEWFWFLFVADEDPDEEPLPAGDTGLPKLESHIKVPMGGWSFDIVEPGAQETITIPAGNYWLASGHPGSLLDVIEELLNAHPGDLVGNYALTADDDFDTSTGRVNFTVTGVASIELDFTASPGLRRALGFSIAQANAVGGTSIASAYSSPHIWLSPECRAPALTPDGARGVPLTDGIVTVASTGDTYAIQRSLRRRDLLEFAQIVSRKVWQEHEQIVNESFEAFWIAGIGKGRRVRYHKRRSNDAVFRTYRLPAINDMRSVVEQETNNWTSDPESLWHIGPLEALTQDAEAAEL